MADDQTKVRRLRVLVVLPRIDQKLDPHDPLADMAIATLRGQELPKDKLSGAGLPAQVEWDFSFGVLPGGPVQGSARESVTPDALNPATTSSFIMRGFIDVGSDGAIPQTLESRRGRGPARLFYDHDISAHLTCGTSRAIDSTREVKSKLGVDSLVQHGLDGDGVAVALVDMGVYLSHLERRLNDDLPKGSPRVTARVDKSLSWRPPFLVTQPFNHRIGHGTMTAYDVLIAASKVTLLDYPMLAARAPGDHSVAGTLSAAFAAYAHLYTNWILGPASGWSTKPKYKHLVINNSWGIYNPGFDFPPGNPNRYTDNPNHPFRNYISALTNYGIDIVFCAGNCGSDCPAPPCLHCTTGTINGASSYDEVLTVAGCDTNDRRVGYSSQGPSIAGMPQQKPDITAYTHFLGSCSRAPWLPDAGTSASSPIAAGCIAALRTKLPSTTSPKILFDAIRATARAGVGVGSGGVWNNQYGFGIIDPVATGRLLGVI